jgi:hypothetical protein
MSLQKHDRVRLKDRYVTALPYRHRKMPTDWSRRGGEVVSCNSIRVLVLWDGRRTPETFSPDVLEKIEEDSNEL